MTLDELLARESIRQTLATYNIFGDRVRVDEFLTAFTEDGVLEFGGERQGERTRHEGREAIRGWMTDWKSRPSSAEPKATPAPDRSRRRCSCGTTSPPRTSPSPGRRRRRGGPISRSTPRPARTMPASTSTSFARPATAG